MKSNKNILYLVDDYLLFYSKQKNQKYKYKMANKVLKNGKIANSKLFIKNYQKFLQTNKLNNNLFGDTLTIIVNPAYTKVDIDVITNIFSSLNYRKINIINEMKIYKFNNTNAYINNNESFLIISFVNEYKEKESYLIEKNLLTLDELINFLKRKFQKRNIFCFGLCNDLEQFCQEIENKTNNLGYHFQNDETFLIDELLLKKNICKKNNI